MIAAQIFFSHLHLTKFTNPSGVFPAIRKKPIICPLAIYVSIVYDSNQYTIFFCSRQQLLVETTKKRGVFLRNLFNIDSPLMHFLGKVADLMILNLLFLITCVPIFTIGASLTALHYVTLRMVSDEDSAVSRDYLRSFKQNFRQATIIWLILITFALLITYDIRLVWNGAGYVNTVMKILSIIASVALVMVILYVFAILAKFHNSVKGTIRNAVAISLSAFPRTLSMFMLVAASVALTFYTEATVRWGLLFWLTFGFSAVAYFNSFLLKKTFGNLITDQTSDKSRGQRNDPKK